MSFRYDGRPTSPVYDREATGLTYDEWYYQQAIDAQARAEIRQERNRRNAAKPLPTFHIGDTVIRKAALGKRGGYRETGIIQWIGSKHARVEWQNCSNRIGGDGNFHTTVKLATLLPLTPENETKRQARLAEDRVARQAQHEATLAGHQARWDNLQPGQKWSIECACHPNTVSYHTYLGDLDGMRQFQCSFCGSVATRAPQPMIWR